MCVCMCGLCLCVVCVCVFGVCLVCGRVCGFLVCVSSRNSNNQAD